MVPTQRGFSSARHYFTLGAVAAGVVALGLVPSGRPALAQPPTPLPEELRYVPADAAAFVHADAAKLWGGPVGKSVRDADPKTFAGLSDQAKSLFGVTPDQLRTVTFFWPQLKGPGDFQFGLVFTFAADFDKDKLRAGFGQLIPKNTPHTLHTPGDRVAVLLLGLDGKYARPQPADQAGPLSAAIREAGTGTHLLVAGTTLASLPDEIRRDDVPADVRPFQPLFRADTMTAVVDLERELTLQVRVKASTPAKAGDAEKSLGLGVTMLREALGQLPKGLGKDADKDPALKDLFAVVKAGEEGLKGAKFSTEGTVARVTVRLPADLPVAGAYTAAATKARAAATRTQSVNNLRQIALAMHIYHDANKAFPPAAVCDKTGKPQLSWRVLILPYIEQNELYKQFKLDEPWDGPNNKKLLDKMPRVYAMPTPTGARPNETHYRVFVGNGAAFDYLRGPKIADFTDGTSNTILVATATTPVPWTKPDELEFDPEKDMTRLLGFFQGDVCPIAMCDGSVRSVGKKLSAKTLNAAITRGGGEVLGDDF